MQEKRVSPRYNALGYAHIPGVLKGELLIRNLSITGCCLEYQGDISLLKPQEIYKIEIKPEPPAKIGKFELETECKWVHQKDNTGEIGLTVTVSPHGKHFQNYVDYIAYYQSKI
jgi:hypothetical protein